ncbi:MAG: hypothetical protein ACPH7I_00370 [Flavobacteriaceae bacterium]
MQEEFTDKMHASLSVTKEQEISQKVHTVLLAMDTGTPFEKALKMYNVTLEQFEKYKSKWEISSKF